MSGVESSISIYQRRKGEGRRERMHAHNHATSKKANKDNKEPSPEIYTIFYMQVCLGPDYGDRIYTQSAPLDTSRLSVLDVVVAVPGSSCDEC